jgi:hypothetical protein
VLAVAKAHDQPALVIDAKLIMPILWAGLLQVGHVVPKLPVDLELNPAFWVCHWLMHGVTPSSDEKACRGGSRWALRAIEQQTWRMLG